MATEFRLNVKPVDVFQNLRGLCFTDDYEDLFISIILKKEGSNGREGKNFMVCVGTDHGNGPWK
jgi:hypothetical protein